MKFLAIVWSESASEQVRVARALRLEVRRSLSSWTTAVDAPGLFVAFAKQGTHGVFTSYALTEERGAVLGRLFEASYIESYTGDASTPRAVAFDDQGSSSIVSGGGRALIDRYWGSYIAFLRDRETDRKWVIRDPTGGLPCQVAAIGNVHVYFCRVVDLEAVSSPPLKVNAKYFLGNVVVGNNFCVETGYENIDTVLPGERIEHAGSTITKNFLWNPVDLASCTVEKSSVETEGVIRRLVSASVHAWASCTESVALQLSGGLDSSIVASCLASAPSRPRITAVNGYLPIETSDERRFAREVAARHNLELSEYYVANPGKIDLSPRLERTVIPDTVDTGASAWREACEILASRGFLVHFRGDGGDEVFYKEGPLPDAVDVAYHNGIGRKLWNVAMNDALIDRTSVWQVLRKAVRYGLRKRPYGPFQWLEVGTRVASPLFTEEARRDALSAPSSGHPLYLRSSMRAPAKFCHAYSLLRYTMRMYAPPPVPAAPTFVLPLVSQPLMDLSLRTPLHVLRGGGRDRARARNAFREQLPSSVLHRRYKGLYTLPTQRWVKEVLPEARELLLDGFLVRERIVDRMALEMSLLGDASADFWTSEILKSCLDCEVWVRDALSHNSSRRERKIAEPS